MIVGSVALTIAGAAVATDPTPSARTLAAFGLVSIGVAGLTRALVHRSVDALERATKRWWIAAFVTFVPYGLATAPSTAAAATVGDPLSGPLASAALESIAGGLVLCAVTVTVLYTIARHGIHPGAPTPEERILEDPFDD